MLFCVAIKSFWIWIWIWRLNSPASVSHWKITGWSSSEDAIAWTRLIRAFPTFSLFLWITRIYTFLQMKSEKYNIDFTTNVLIKEITRIYIFLQMKSVKYNIDFTTNVLIKEITRINIFLQMKSVRYNIDFTTNFWLKYGILTFCKLSSQRVKKNSPGRLASPFVSLLDKPHWGRRMDDLLQLFVLNHGCTFYKEDNFLCT